MADQTHIEWTDATWNPITGCTLVSDGCKHCYAATLAATRLKHHPSRAGLARLNAAGEAKFTGEVRFNEQWLDQPLRWRKPRMIFVCAHGDLFHENVPDEWIDKVFAVMGLAKHHTFQVLTKRPDRMREYMARRDDQGHHPAYSYAVLMAMTGRWNTPEMRSADFIPLPNVWLGVSVENQEAADQRIPDLLQTPAAVRFVSAEPLLGPVDLTNVAEDGHSAVDATREYPAYQAYDDWGDEADEMGPFDDQPPLDWVIVGGESGRNARPMHPDWARSLRDQCVAADVSFFFKQWGEWLPGEFAAPPDVYFQNGDWMDVNTLPDIDVEKNWCEDWSTDEYEGHAIFKRVGKRAAGRLLDGREWNEVPG